MAKRAPVEAFHGRLDVRFLGQAAFEADGAAVRFAKRNRTLAMLARIILLRGAPIARDVLAFSIFPDDDESTAIAELRRYLYLAGKALPESPRGPWLVADAETVRWNLEAGASVDVFAFETYAADPQTHAQAIELYRGDLLDEIYDDWIAAERERLRARYLTILSESIDRHRSERRYALAIESAKRILVADPWREDTVRALMSVRYEAGDTAGALAEFERFAKHLRAELGIAPMPETLAVQQSIVRGDVVPGATAAAREDGSARAAALPFVGRAREMGALRAAWTRAARGHGNVVLIEGEAGVGKSRLGDELARLVQSEGGRTFVGTTAAPESTPYQSIVEALRSAMPLLLARPPVAARRAALARLLPELRDSAAPEVPAPEQPADRELARLHDALTDAVRRLATPRPTLIVLEDLQWAGSATIEALGAIARDALRVPALIVATCREEETPPAHPLRTLMRALSTNGNVVELALSRFEESDVSELVARIEPLRERSAAFARELFLRSEGNALFVNEFIRVALAGEAVPSGATSSIANVLAARVAQLSESALTVAQIASVAGAGCNVALVRDVSNLPAAETARGFDDLLDRRILREAGARTAFDYVFTHHLIAEAIYAGIAPELRARRHARIARLMESAGARGLPAPEREIARHYERAGERETAAGWYVRAAASAAGLHAYGDAIELATLALQFGQEAGIRREALEVRERSYGRRAERGRQRADIDELESLAGDDLRRQFDVLTRRVLLARTLGQSDEEGALIARMHGLEAALGDDARAQALVQSATFAGLRSRPTEALEPALGALALYERSGDVRGQLECLYLLVDFTANIGDLEASRAYLARMHERAGDLGDRLVEARALGVAAQAALLRAEYRSSYDLSRQALALQLATGDRDGEAASRGRLAVSGAWLGDFATALRDFELALETYASIGNTRGLALTYTNRTLLLMRLGLFDDALDSIAHSNELFAVAHEERTVVANKVNASFVSLQRGDAPQAQALALEALELAKQIGFPVFEAAALANLGNAERALGFFERAIAHMEAGIALRRAVQEPRDFVDDLADLTLAYAGAGRNPDALRTAEELLAIDGGRFAGALWPHYVRWAVAQGLGAGGQAERAAAEAARARDEMRAFAERIDDERARGAFLAVPINVAIAAQPAAKRRTIR
jgi:DNA-binding SARP family transcriptional activator/tetratricopeptide (TPR) repeat protein